MSYPGTKYRESPLKRLERRLLRNREITPDGCWIWTGGTTNVGWTSGKYGKVGFMNRTILVHRAAMMVWKEFDINSPLQINHKRECKNSLCFNPEHLYKGNQSENIRDAVHKGTHESKLQEQGWKGNEGWKKHNAISETKVP